MARQGRRVGRPYFPGAVLLNEKNPLTFSASNCGNGLSRLDRMAT